MLNLGQVITQDMLTIQTVNRNLVPNNATSNIEVIQNYALQTKDGNDIQTVQGENGELKLSINIDNRDYDVLKEDETENYYIMRNNEKQYLELNSVPLVAKVDMNKNTVITTELISKSDDVVQDDVRKQEYNMLVLPMDLTTGDYIDVRIQFPSGQDYIVVSKKEVEMPTINGIDSEDTLWINLSEDEILHMSCAIVEAFRINGTKLYVTKYTEPGMQEAATPTYPVNASVRNQINNDPNIVERAMNEIRARYDQGLTDLRNNDINSLIEAAGEQSDGTLQSNMQQSITNSKNSRKEYLDSLAGAAAATTAQ